MKTLILGMLLSINNSIINHHEHKSNNRVSSPVSTLKVDLSQSQVSWKAEKLTGTHTGTLKIFLGQVAVQNHRLTGGSILLDMNSISVTDLEAPDKQKLEANLKGDNFFDTGRHTVARFDITSVNYASPSDTSKATITGKLNMHGLTKNISFRAGVLKCNAKEFAAKADIAINRRDWNIATASFKYDTFIKPTITLHILLKAL
ncbi:hypothetical protein BH09BAC6_BH09BAC6_29780 [soil metagenome]|jgi:polyisoprenoid-binding protein YceI